MSYSGWWIFCLERGFTIVGKVEEDTNGVDFLFLTLTKASIVRRWGTSKGLGQLAVEGKQRETVLDPLTTGTKINRSRIIFGLPCNPEKWD